MSGNIPAPLSAPAPIARGPPPGSLPALMGENLSQKALQQLLAEIGDLLGVRLECGRVAVASYVANTMNPAAANNAQMNMTHEKPLFDVLGDARADSDHIALILNTLGGDGGLPTRIVRFVKEDLKATSFHVVVPHLAKSAGTLLGFASDGVVTGQTSQFGPIDPQLPRITNAGQTWVSARAVKESYEKLLGATLATLPPAAQIGVMANIDWLLHQQALDAIQYTKEFIARIKSTTHQGLKEADVVRELIETPLAHGSDVSPTKLAGYGLPVVQLTPNDSLWIKLSEYLGRSLKCLQMEQAPPPTTGLLLFESARITIGTNGLLQPVAK